MMLFVLTFVVLALAILGLGVGLLLGRGPLQGSCGGNAVVKVCAACNRETTR